MRLECDPFYSPAKLAKAFTGMDELEVKVFRASFGTSDYRVLEGFSIIRGVKRAKVYGSVDRGFAERLEKVMQSDVKVM